MFLKNRNISCKIKRSKVTDYAALSKKKIKKSIKLCLFSYPSVKTCVVGAQKNRLIEMVLLSTHNICLG